MNAVAINSSYKTWDGAWVQKAEWEKIAEEFAGWGEHIQKIIQLLTPPEINVAAWSMWDHPRAPTYCKGRVVMMGDAAHASAPFQGQGAGQAIEDAYVLSSLFDVVNGLVKIPLAFKAYDRIRRPRSQMVCKTSREAGELCSLRLPGVDDNAEAFKENIMWRTNWMWHRDIEREHVEAVNIFEKLMRERGPA